MYKKLPINNANDRAGKFMISCLERAYSYKCGQQNSTTLANSTNSLEYWLQTSDQYYKGYYPLHMEKALWRTFKTYVPHFNAYQIRVSTLEDVFLDHRFNTQNKPFTVSPTPVISLPYGYREKVADHIMSEFNIYNFIEKTATNPAAQQLLERSASNPLNPMGEANRLAREAKLLSDPSFNPLSTDPNDLVLMNPALNLINTRGFDDLVKLYSDVGKSILTGKAKKSAKKMENLMYDQMVQTQFKKNVFTKLIGYLARYPLTVVKGATFLHNSKTKPVSYEEGYIPTYDSAYSLSLGFESINPYNIFFFDDASDLNNSSCVIDVSYHTPSDFSPYLGELTKNEMVGDELDSDHSGSSKTSGISRLYQKNRVAKAMEKMRDTYSSTHGLSSYVRVHGSPIQYSFMNTSYWNKESSSSIPKINMTKKMMGWEIRDELYGDTEDREEKDALKEIKDYDAYIVTMEMVCDEVILAYYRPYEPDSMGYYASSFRNEPDKIVGTGLCELIKPIQDQINDILISMCRATQWESRGLTVIDEELIDPNSLNGDYQIQPGQVIRSKYDPHGVNSPNMGNRVPITRLNPNTTNHRNLYMTLKDLMKDVDEITGIHGTLSGISRSSSENRVGTVYTTKVNYAMKPIQRMANGVDANIIEPMFGDLYEKNMMFHWDDSIKGDSRLMIEGATGMLSRNLKQENMVHTLQIVQQGVATGAFTTDVLNGVLTEMLEINGYDIDSEKIRSDVKSLPEAQDVIKEQQRIEQENLIRQKQRQASLLNGEEEGGNVASQIANNPNLPPDVAQALAGNFNSSQGQVGNRLSEDGNRVNNIDAPAQQLGNTLNVPESNTDVPSVANNVQTVDNEQL